MCFSPEFDLATGAVISVAAVDSVRHVTDRSEVPLAVLPGLFAVHSVMSAVAWLGFEGRVPAWVGDAASWLFMLIAFVALPAWVPWAVRAVEPPGPARTRIGLLAALGSLVALVLLGGMLFDDPRAVEHASWISYSVDVPAKLLVTVAYVVATCGAMLLSSRRELVIYGCVNVAAVAFLWSVEHSGFASLWCMWAAITSVLIALWLRREAGVPQAT